MENNLIPRIGTFFLVVSVGLLVIFIGSAFSRDLHLEYFLFSVVTFFIGTILRRGASRPQSGRFGSINMLRNRNRRQSDEKQEKEINKKWPN